MDKEFMDEYYTMKYIAGECDIPVMDEEAYSKLDHLVDLLEDELMKLCGGTNSEVWKKYEAIMDVHIDIQALVNEAHYLQGASDRERMLK